MGVFTFSKVERLSKKKWIEDLFDRGFSFSLSPFKVIFLPNPDSTYPTHQILISISKRNFKKAVDRNTLKRRIREAYRLNKHQLTTQKKWLIAYIYVAKEILPSATIHQKLMLTFKNIMTKDHEQEK